MNFNASLTSRLLTTLVVVGIAAAPLTSCKKKEGCTDPSAVNYDPDADNDDGTCIYASTDPTTVINGQTYHVLSGTIGSSRTLGSDKRWLLSGGVFVANGAVLTIDAGTMIYAADDGTTPFLSVQRGGRINAVGSPSAPIVFTTIKTITGGAAPGAWGGIVLNGYAQINICGGGGCTAEGEGGSGTYGGSDDSDNSGVMKYVRVEYAGKILGTDNELNGFSFNGVGSGTVLEHLQAYKGSDDGFEFFGGTATLKWALSTGNSDDSFDWSHGWRGKGQFWAVHQDPASCDRGFECDNWETDFMVQPFSNPIVSNFTIVAADDGTASEAVRLRHGTRGRLYNGLVAGAGVGSGIRVSDSCSTWMDQGLLICRNTTAYGFATNWKDCDPFASDATNSATDPGVLSGYVGTENANAVDPTTLDSWFSPATYKGAVPAGDEWTSGWTLPL
ncbi:MAG: hypothetical protein IPG35_16865 [Flavobacteriales bacterium]|nr:hypothetical protein [Flavobacteriales bacterium]MBK8949740.1 hypothetical protein [Flavobacteriales bacterium]MBK9701597.1 hypothetical protein [Flavobacteriales bacterium]